MTPKKHPQAYKAAIQLSGYIHNIKLNELSKFFVQIGKKTVINKPCLEIIYKKV